MVEGLNISRNVLSAERPILVAEPDIVKALDLMLLMLKADRPTWHDFGVLVCCQSALLTLRHWGWQARRSSWKDSLAQDRRCTVGGIQFTV